jgi:hypothetical protein
MIPILLFFGLCFFGLGDCQEDVVSDIEPSVNLGDKHLEFEQSFSIEDVTGIIEGRSIVSTSDGYNSQANIDVNHDSATVTPAIVYKYKNIELLRISFHQTDSDYFPSDALYGISIDKNGVAMTEGLKPMDLRNCYNSGVVCFPSEERLVYVIDELSPEFVTIDEIMLQKSNQRIIDVDRESNRLFIDIDPDGLIPPNDYPILPIMFLFVPIHVVNMPCIFDDDVKVCELEQRVDELEGLQNKDSVKRES